MLTKEQLLQPHPHKLLLLMEFITPFKTTQRHNDFSQLRGITYEEYLGIKKYTNRALSEDEFNEIASFIDAYFENGHPDFKIMQYERQWGEENRKLVYQV